MQAASNDMMPATVGPQAVPANHPQQHAPSAPLPNGVTSSVDYTGLIGELANQQPPTPLTNAFRALLSGYPNAVFSQYEIKVICAMIMPSILLPTSPYYDQNIDEGQRPAAVSVRLMSQEFSHIGRNFVEEAVKAQAEKTDTAWIEHNAKLAAMFSDVLAMITQRNDSIDKLIKTHGNRHPMIAPLKDAVEQEYRWLDACILDNKEAYEKHRRHLEGIKARSAQNQR